MTFINSITICLDLHLHDHYSDDNIRHNYRRPTYFSSYFSQFLEGGKMSDVKRNNQNVNIHQSGSFDWSSKMMVTNKEKIEYGFVKATKRK